MNRPLKVVGFLFITLLGAYGCAQGPVAESGKGTSRDTKVQKLEEDLRTVAAARDSYRQKLAAAEERHLALQKQLTTTATERDGLKAEVKVRTTERDGLQLQYETFRKSIRELLGQAESSLTTPPSLVGSTAK